MHESRKWCCKMRNLAEHLLTCFFARNNKQSASASLKSFNRVLRPRESEAEDRRWNFPSYPLSKLHMTNASDSKAEGRFAPISSKPRDDRKVKVGISRESTVRIRGPGSVRAGRAMLQPITTACTVTSRYHPCFGNSHSDRRWHSRFLDRKAKAGFGQLWELAASCQQLLLAQSRRFVAHACATPQAMGKWTKPVGHLWL